MTCAPGRQGPGSPPDSRAVRRQRGSRTPARQAQNQHVGPSVPAGVTASPRASSGRLPEPVARTPAPRSLPTPSPSFPWGFCSLLFQKMPCSMIRLGCVFRFRIRKIKGLRLVKLCKKSLIINFKELFVCKAWSKYTWISGRMVPSLEKRRLPLPYPARHSADPLPHEVVRLPAAGPFVVANGVGMSRKQVGSWGSIPEHSPAHTHS